MIDKYQEQVDSLAKELGVEIRPCKLMLAMMYVELGYIEAPLIVDQQTYLTNLHELGHVAHGHSQGRPPHTDKRFYFDNGVLKSEAQAWEWTFDHCIDDVSDSNRQFIWNKCLGSYYWWYSNLKGQLTRLDGHGDRAYCEFEYDHPDVYFESVMKRIIKNLPMQQPYYGRWDNKPVS